RPLSAPLRPALGREDRGRQLTDAGSLLPQDHRLAAVIVGQRKRPPLVAYERPRVAMDDLESLARLAVQRVLTHPCSVSFLGNRANTAAAIPRSSFAVRSAPWRISTIPVLSASRSASTAARRDASTTRTRSPDLTREPLAPTEK